MTTDRKLLIGLTSGLAITILLGYALQCFGAEPCAESQHTLNINALLYAHEMAESSGIDRMPYKDGPQQSWGLFAFGVARWIECGGRRQDWGRPGIAHVQRAVMARALRRYLRNCPANASVVQKVVWTANHHNLGHGTFRRTKHANKVLRFYRQGYQRKTGRR